MDHIPPCSDGLAHRAFQVPFLGSHGFTYDAPGFRDYPDRVNVDVDRLVKDGQLGLQLSRSAGFIQAWLWFGMIHETVLLLCSPDATRMAELWRSFDLVKADHGTAYVSLKGFLARFPEPLPGNNPRQVKFGRSDFRILRRLKIAIEFASALVRNNPTALAGSTDLSLVLLSTEVLYQTMKRLLSEKEPATTKFSRQLGKLEIQTDAVNHLLKSLGWCPRELDRLPRDPVYRYHLSFYHQSILSEEPNHTGIEGCTCKFSKPAKIQPLHTLSNCNCQIISIDKEDLDNILSSRQTPLLRFTENPDQTRSLVIQGYSLSAFQQTPFVAVSHVRTAGLGNDNANALPSCQLLEIQKLSNSLLGSGKDVPVWLDTICLPTDRKERKMAVHSVWKIFSAAKHVLVLDPPLFTHDFGSAQEALIRIRYSLWKRRMWTLDEGFFSENLVFRFKTSSISLSALLNDFEQKEKATPIASKVLMSLPSTLDSHNESKLRVVLLRFGDDIRLLSWNDHSRGRDTCHRTHLYRLLRLGYLMAEKFRYFLEEDERANIPGLWRLLVETYGSCDDAELARQHAHLPDTAPIVRRLTSMSSFKWK